MWLKLTAKWFDEIVLSFQINGVWNWEWYNVFRHFSCKFRCISQKPIVWILLVDVYTGSVFFWGWEGSNLFQTKTSNIEQIADGKGITRSQCLNSIRSHIWIYKISCERKNNHTKYREKKIWRCLWCHSEFNSVSYKAFKFLN